MIYQCSVTSCGSSVNFTSSVDLLPLFQREEYTCFVPEMTTSNVAKHGAPHLLYMDKNTRILQFGSHETHVEFPWEEMRNGETLLYLSYPLIETEHQRQRRITMHAACISLENQGVLILGKEGAGKSSTAIELCRSYNAKIIANDLCVVGSGKGGLTAFGGTKFFFLRQESVRRSLPDIECLFPSTNGDTWLTKVKVSPENIGAEKHQGLIVVKKVVLVHVDDTKGDIFISNGDSLATRLYLNENFSRYIRTTCTTMLGRENYDFLGFVPSLDTPEFFEMRKILIFHILENIGITYISGPVKCVARWIAENTTN